MQKKVEGLYSSYQAEQVLLTEAMKQERWMNKKEGDRIEGLSEKVFGFGGLFFLKKQELIKPLQDKVFDATGR